MARNPVHRHRLLQHPAGDGSEVFPGGYHRLVSRVAHGRDIDPPDHLHGIHGGDPENCRFRQDLCIVGPLRADHDDQRGSRNAPGRRRSHTRFNPPPDPRGTRLLDLRRRGPARPGVRRTVHLCPPRGAAGRLLGSHGHVSCALRPDLREISPRDLGPHRVRHALDRWGHSADEGRLCPLRACRAHQRRCRRGRCPHRNRRRPDGSDRRLLYDDGHAALPEASGPADYRPLSPDFR